MPDENAETPPDAFDDGKPTETPEPEDDGPEVIQAHVEARPVVIETRNGQRNYMMTEMNGDDLAFWMARIQKRFGRKKKSEIGQKDFKGSHADLIYLCIRDDKNQRVPKVMIESWGARALNKLFAIAQDMNGLNDKVEEREGKG